MKTLFLTLLLGACALTLADGSAPIVNVRVDGDGYMRFVRDGKMVYAKSAKLTIIDGRIAQVSGPAIVPAINMPSVKTFTVNLEGLVLVDGVPYGQMVLALFKTELSSPDPEGFLASTTRPTLGNPGEGANGVLRIVNAAAPTTVKIDKPVTAHKGETAPDVASNVVTQATNPKPKATAQTNQTRLPGTVPNTTVHAGPGIQITFPDRIEVDTETFSLGQIATINAGKSDADQIGNIELGDTPPLGVDRIVDRNRITYRLKAAGIDPVTVSMIGPDRVHVTRKGQKVAHSQFVEAAIQGAVAKGNGGTLESLTPGPEMTVPIGKLELICESVNNNNQETNVTVGVYVDGKRFNSRSVKLKQTGVVSTIKVGTIVSVRVVSRGVSVEAKGKIMKVDQSTGQVTVQMVETGAQLVGTMMPNGSVEVKA